MNISRRTKGDEPGIDVRPLDWQQTQATQCSPDMIVEMAAQFQRAASITAKHGDAPRLESHVIVEHHNEYWIGKITEILVPTEQQIASHVIISLLEFLPEIHPQLHMLCIRYPVPEQKIAISLFVCLAAIVCHIITNLLTLGCYLHSQCSAQLHNVPVQFNQGCV